ncbi:hypothetical protein [Pseudarthrobacter siccitolerans]
MSEELAETEQQSRSERPTKVLVNAEWIVRSAKAVLAVNLDDVPLTRVTQFIVGWCRAAFAQSQVVGQLAISGSSSASAPNRRLFAELAIRLQWMLDLPKEVRPSAVDEILEIAREAKLGTHKHLRDMGWDVGFDATEMNSFVLAGANGEVKNQARKFAAAAHATDVKNGPVFAMWREDSYLAHPTGPLAGEYAPAIDNEILGQGLPGVLDRDLSGHRDISMLVIMVTCSLLRDEGAGNAPITRLSRAFFSA